MLRRIWAVTLRSRRWCSSWMASGSRTWWLLIVPWWFLLRAWWTSQMRWRTWVTPRLSMLKRLELLWWSLWNLIDLSNARTAVIKAWWWTCRWLRNTPLRTRWAVGRCWLICLWVNVLGQRSAILIRHAVGRATILQKLQSCLNVSIVWIQISSSLIGVERISGLIVARFILKVS
jgi:hypothetical protein